MRYKNDDAGFSFELPDDWRRDEHNLTITFYGPNGGIGVQSEVIQLMIGGISPEYVDPANREEYLSEPGAEIFRTEIGGEQNAVVFKKVTNSEISVVRDGLHYCFSHAHDPATQEAIELIRQTAQFPSFEQAADCIRRWSEPKLQAVTKALRSDSPEAARRALAEAGAPGVRMEGGTFHELDPQSRRLDRSEKKWWQFWR